MLETESGRCRGDSAAANRAGKNSLDETLVDAHLVLVPGLGTLTVGGLTGGDLEGLGGKADGALDLEGLGAGTVDQLLADLLEGGNLAGGEGDADLVDLLQSGQEAISIEFALVGSIDTLHKATATARCNSDVRQ
jgi:hypothetical protein